MKGILEYDLPDDQDSFLLAQKAWAMNVVLEEITNRIFRPARKHGYPDQDLSNLLKEIDEIHGDGGGTKLIEMLEEMFHELMKEYGL
jgi:hypothetical protein